MDLKSLFVGPDNPESYIHGALRDTYGEPEDAAVLLKTMRDRNPRDLSLRNAEHALFGQVLRQENPYTAPASVVGYSALKGLMQHGMPTSWAEGLSKGLRRQFGGSMPSPHSTPASLSELAWGLAPYWGGIPDLANYRAQVP